MTEDTRMILDKLNKLDELEKKITDIQLTLENELRRVKERISEIA